MTAPAIREEQYDAFGNPIKAKAKEAAPLPLATGTQTAGAPSAYANVVPQTPGGAGNYLGQTIQPGAGVDRIGLAQKAWETSQAQSAPAYEASLRQAKQQAAGVGQLGSGQLRTQLGDLALQRGRDMDAERQRLMNEAITGSIADQYQNIGIAQQQQQFQAAQQTTDFQQQLAREEAALQRALGLGNLGISQQQADTQRLQATGQLGLSEKQLAQQERMQAAGFAQESAESAKARAQQEAIQKAAFGQESEQARLAREQQLTLAQRGESEAEKQRVLQERMQATGLSAEAAQAQLDREQREQMQTAQFGQETEQARLAREQQAAQFGQTLTLQQQQADLDHKVRTGQLTLAEAQQKAQENQFAAEQAQRATLAEKQRQLEADMQKAGFGQQIELAKRGEAESKLDRAQQLDLATKAAEQQTAMQTAQFGQETAQGALNRAIQEAANKNQAQQIANQLTLGTYSNQTEREASLAQQELAKNQLWAQLAQALGIQNLQAGLINLGKPPEPTPETKAPPVPVGMPPRKTTKV